MAPLTSWIGPAQCSPYSLSSVRLWSIGGRCLVEEVVAVGVIVQGAVELAEVADVDALVAGGVDVAAGRARRAR